MNIKKLFPVTVIIPMRNSETTVIKTLQSLLLQKYPIEEVIIIDNASTDDSIKLVIAFQKHCKISIRLVLNKKNIGVGGSCNIGARLAKSQYIIMMHSDSILPTKNELKKLTDPFRGDPNVVASASSIILPEKIWSTYNFWQKCLLCRSVNKKVLGLNDKFDCLSKEKFLSIGGFDTRHYGHHHGVGSEDMDLALRLQKVGKVVGTESVVIHLHSLNNTYSFLDWIENRKLLARSYGRLIRMRGSQIFPGAFIFLMKPTLLITCFIPILFPYNFVITLIFSIVYMEKMYTSKSSYRDPRIVLLPFITIFLIFYESLWMIESFLYLDQKKI